MTRAEYLTDAQYETLRDLVAGVQPRRVAKSTRRTLERKGYVTARRVANHRYEFAITDAGRTALTSLPRLRPSIPKGLL